MVESIPATGLYIVYEPEAEPAIVDIVIIHGFWTASLIIDQESARWIRNRYIEARKLLAGVTSWLKKASSFRGTKEENISDRGDAASENKRTRQTMFWPADLLPNDCPNARILTYGYDTKITKYTSGLTNKNSVFAHGKDFLYALGRSRIIDRPLIFVAHSLGGIVVKEMLAFSSTSDRIELKNIVTWTTGIIFLGTPHRGSPDLSAIGEWARSGLNLFRFQTTSKILDTLGLKTTDLERAQGSFSALWRQHNFQVKTFQEAFGLTGINLGVLGNKVVPDTSSLIGDDREHAETLQANHVEMCRFTGPRDPNYIKVAGELRSMHSSLEDKKFPNSHQSMPRFHDVDLPAFNHMLKACLQYLRFPNMENRYQSIESPAADTGLWLLQNKAYTEWLLGHDLGWRNCLLRLVGKPGAGKSTLMKEALRYARVALPASTNCIAHFFADAKAGSMGQSPLGIYRSLLYQLLPHYPDEAIRFYRDWKDEICARDSDSRDQNGQERRLQIFCYEILRHFHGKRVYIFIDAVDELGGDNERSQIEFWTGILLFASQSHVRVCLSSRHYPFISFLDSNQLVVEHHNGQDISTYIKQRFETRITAEELHWVPLLQEKLATRSSGVFIWVSLVVDKLLDKYDEGKSLKFLLEHIDALPPELESLYGQLIDTLDVVAKPVASRLFQWALLTTRPLRLHEWHHVLAFIKQPPPKSLQEWRMSMHYTENDQQLEREIKTLSRGLLELSTKRTHKTHDGDGSVSVIPGAGSLDDEQGESRVIQAIHQSVGEFFLNGNGFSYLDASLQSNPVGRGHLSIVGTCLDYFGISELDDLIEARNKRDRVSLNTPTQPTWSWPSSASEAREVAQSTWGVSPARSLLQQHELDKLPSADPRTSIVNWITTGVVSLDHASLPGQTHDSVSQASAASGSKVHVLRDYPALLLYAISELDFHIKIAREMRADIASIVDRLAKTLTWSRLVALKEDLPWDTSPAEYIDQWCGYSIDHHVEVPVSRHVEVPLSPRDSNVGDDDRHSWSSRSGSIASFGSASSYFKSTRRRRRPRRRPNSVTLPPSAKPTLLLLMKK
ncbi:hypothetical protein ACJZ2D_011844 [Fusarium nematophilum]